MSRVPTPKRRAIKAWPNSCNTTHVKKQYEHHGRMHRAYAVFASPGLPNDKT